MVATVTSAFSASRQRTMTIYALVYSPSIPGSITSYPENGDGLRYGERQ